MGFVPFVINCPLKKTDFLFLGGGLSPKSDTLKAFIHAGLKAKNLIWQKIDQN